VLVANGHKLLLRHGAQATKQGGLSWRADGVQLVSVLLQSVMSSTWHGKIIWYMGWKCDRGAGATALHHVMLQVHGCNGCAAAVHVKWLALQLNTLDVCLEEGHDWRNYCARCLLNALACSWLVCNVTGALPPSRRWQLCLVHLRVGSICFIFVGMLHGWSYGKFF
jgi:hypothetical protein